MRDRSSSICNLDSVLAYDQCMMRYNTVTPNPPSTTLCYPLRCLERGQNGRKRQEEEVCSCDEVVWLARRDGECCNGEKRGSDLRELNASAGCQLPWHARELTMCAARGCGRRCSTVPKAAREPREGWRGRSRMGAHGSSTGCVPIRRWRAQLTGEEMS